MISALLPDPETLRAFVDADFRYADAGTFVSWRAFRDDRKDAPAVFHVASAVPAVHAVDALAAVALDAATDAATRPFPVVFCPPVCTFTNADRGRKIDLANGLAVIVECDTNPAASRVLLEKVLGPATLVAASGGVTADGEAKLHLHWRLSEPTTTSDEHDRLELARRAAAILVGGDMTNVPIVHPIRWPGSVHRKGTPRLATIVALNADREIDLSDVLDRLGPAVPAVARDGSTTAAAGEAGISTSALITELMSGAAIHAPLVSLSYRLLKSGVPDDQCVVMLRGFMDAIPDAVRNRPDQPERWAAHYHDVWRTVVSAREKLEAERDPSERVDVTAFLAEVQRAPMIYVPRHATSPRDTPPELLSPPGVLGDVARYGVESSVRPVPIFAVQAALALGSVVCGRRFMTSQRNYSSLYFLNVARSGTGKEEAKTTIESLLAAAGYRRLVGGSQYTSGGAVFSALLKKPQHLAIIDEFGQYLEAASGDRATYKAEALTQLMEAFGRVHSDMMTPQYSTMTVSQKAASNHEPRAVSRPAITLLAMTTPSTFYDTMTSRRILDGFLNRFLIVEHDAERTVSRDWRLVDVPPAIVDWIKAVLAPHGDMDLLSGTDTLGAPRLIAFTEPARQASKDFEREMNTLANRLDRESLGDMPIRSREIAMRLALIIALSEHVDHCAITENCFAWAATYVRHFLYQTIEVLRTRVADSKTAHVRNTVLNVVRGAGARGLTARELNRTKEFFGIPKRERADALESLLNANLIAHTTIETEGRPRVVLVAVSDDADETGEKDETVVSSQPLELVSA